MSKILLNTTKPNQVNISFGYLDNYIDQKTDNEFVLNCLYNKFDKTYINFSKLKENFALLLEAVAAIDTEDYVFSFPSNLSDYEIVSILQAIDIGLNENFTFIFNVEDKEKTKTTISLYKKLTKDEKVKSLFLEKQNNGTLKKESQVFSQLLFNYKPDYTNKKLLIIDTHNKYHRDYQAMPHLTNKQGQETMVIKSFLKMISGIEKNKPDYIILASEGKDGIRYEISSDYKKNRKKPDEALVSQISEIEKLCDKLGIKVVSVNRYEADDVIASYASKFAEFGGKVQVVTTDKDLYQLISSNISIYNPVTKKIIKENDCIEKFGVKPEEIKLFLALKGDTSDNISGIKGVGDKKAAEYINNFGNTIEDIINGAKTLKEGSAARKNLENGIEDLRLSYELVTLFDYLADTLYDFEEFKFPEKLNWASIEEDIRWFEIIL